MTDILTRAEDALNGITEGPWAYRPQKYDDWGVVRGGKIEGEDGWLGYICQAKDQRVTEEQENEARRDGVDPWEANARFIAAAPDLVRDLMAEVERLRAALREIDDKVSWEINPSNYHHDDVCHMNTDWCEVGNIARAAIEGDKP